MPLENLTFSKSKTILQYSALKVWNNLQANFRESATLSQFKLTLKRHYFHLAFKDFSNFILN